MIAMEKSLLHQIPGRCYAKSECLVLFSIVNTITQNLHTRLSENTLRIAVSEKCAETHRCLSNFP